MKQRNSGFEMACFGEQCFGCSTRVRNLDPSVRGPGGHQRKAGPRGRAVGVSGAVMVLVLKGSMRGIRGWFYFFCTTLGSPVSILVCS